MKCDICGKNFDKPKSFINHYRWHKLPKYEKFQEKYCKTISELNSGGKNGMWKGNKVTYGALHDYIKYHLPKPIICPLCGNDQFLELHNKSGEYIRDLDDWEWICRRCHMEKDRRLFRLHLPRR